MSAKLINVRGKTGFQYRCPTDSNDRKREDFDKVVLREKETRISISRIPRKTKAAFIELAEEEFEGDYGMTLKSMVDNFSLWKMLFENVDMKLDIIIDKLKNKW